MKEPIIKIENLSKSFGKKKIFRNLNLEIYPGDRVALLGYNGVGKTTLMEIICDLKKYTSGKISYLGGKKAFFKSLGMQFQISDYPLGIRVKDLIYLYTNVYKTKIDQFLLKELNIKSLYNQNFNDLSFGQKKRVELFTLLISKVKFLILDEITSGMDIFYKTKVLKILQEIFQKEKKEIIYISHNVDEIKYICNRVVIMKREGIVYNSNFKNEKIVQENIDRIFYKEKITL